MRKNLGKVLSMHKKKDSIKEVSEIDQPSAKWTTIQILNELFDQLDEKEKTQSVEICLSYLMNEEDWIVINQSLNFIRNHLHFCIKCSTKKIYYLFVV